MNALPPSTVGLLAKLPSQVSRFHAPVIIAVVGKLTDRFVLPRRSQRNRGEATGLNFFLSERRTECRTTRCRILDSFRFAYMWLICLTLNIGRLFPETIRCESNDCLNIL